MDASTSPRLPRERGPYTAYLFDLLRGPVRDARTGPAVTADNALADDDVQLALYCCYELHYRGFAGVDERWEWSPSVLAFRAHLESMFEAALDVVAGPRVPVADIGTALIDLVRNDRSPSVSAHLASAGTIEQARELCIHRSAYQLKEADPHTWAIPRLRGASKAALVAIQADEYGGGDADAMHSTLFAVTMQTLGLDDTYGAYLDDLPASTLATVNLISFFGLHRRNRGALVGHLAAFELSSVSSMTRLRSALERLGVRAEGWKFHAVHVEADAEHEDEAVSLVRALAADEPGIERDILWGAAALVELEARFARHILEAWAARTSSLRGSMRLAIAG
ncbi:MAG TPA: iron-containing redox enzyme family protein [Acidimicrobiales bacterium]|nr:iron-containing redox enzyme family protein [Acidimicrobiales bacterium]